MFYGEKGPKTWSVSQNLKFDENMFTSAVRTFDGRENWRKQNPVLHLLNS